MKYRKKPVIVDAFQMTRELYVKMYNDFYESGYDSQKIGPENYSKRYFKIEKYNFPDWFNKAWKKGVVYFSIDTSAGVADCVLRIFITTLEGNHLVGYKDFIIKGVKGELYPCKPDIFKLTYEKVE